MVNILNSIQHFSSSSSSLELQTKNYKLILFFFVSNILTRNKTLINQKLIYSSNHWFIGMLLNAWFKIFLNNFPMLCDAAGLISCTNSLALVLRNWLIASPEKRNNSKNEYIVCRRGVRLRAEDLSSPHHPTNVECTLCFQCMEIMLKSNFRLRYAYLIGYGPRVRRKRNNVKSNFGWSG